ncbi:MAG TPA: squalene/phytoene synthase family protein, partial [Acidobacteriaceae bacterium]
MSRKLATSVPSNHPGAFAESVPAQGRELEAAYRLCRAIARHQAKNFYYAFLALPRPKHNAICAVYAFMRQADDLSDDESLPIATRRG